MKNRKYAASEPIIEETKEAGEKLGINDASTSRAGRTLKKKSTVLNAKEATRKLHTTTIKCLLDMSRRSKATIVNAISAEWQCLKSAYSGG